jgi:hypothetical protein
MRFRTACAWICLAAASALGSCGEPAQAATAEDTLVLEVGGGQASLRDALRSMGREVAPPRLTPPAAAPEGPAHAGPAAPREAAARPVEPSPEPSPSPPPEALEEWVWVELLEDETLSHASYRLLGTSRRWREIMAWNGIQEADLRRLRAGFRFKVKRAELK